MKITITGRKVNLRDNFKELAKKKLSRFDRIFDEDADANVVVTLEKNRQTVEITIKQRGMIYRARAQGATPVLVTPPPLDAGRYFNWVSRKLNADNILDYLGDVQYIYRWQEHYASAIRRIASETGCALCDIRDQFLALRRIDRLLCVDGIHPNQQGYSIISNYATKRLNEVYDVVI